MVSINFRQFSKFTHRSDIDREDGQKSNLLIICSISKKSMKIVQTPFSWTTELEFYFLKQIVH